MVGKTLAHYTILEKLGAGGMGEVFAAEDTRLNRRVALKILSSDTADDPVFLRRFEREAKAVASLNHPNIVTIYSVEEAAISEPETGKESADADSKTLHFITMELVDGHALNEEIPDSGMSLDRFFAIAIPLADALASAHASGIVHRDLKPANIMIGQDGRLKILDFGLAKLRPEAGDGLDEVTQALTQEGSILGTVPYMAPEQLQGRDADHRSDIFSLGIVLYEMATGDRPFRGKSQVDVISSILRDSPQPPSDINRAFPLHIERILTRALEKSPESRYQGAEEIKEALYKLQLEMDAKGTARFEALDEEALERVKNEKAGTQTTPPVTKPTSGERPRWLVPAIAGSAALLLLLLGLLFGRSDSPEPETAKAPEPAPGVATPIAKRVAVLTLRDLGTPPDTAFSAGVSAEIASRMASSGAIEVISPASTQSLLDDGRSPREIGQEFAADHVLAGTVRWSTDGNEPRSRLTLSLIRTADDVQVWSRNFDRTIQDSFAVQGEIAGLVTADLEGLTGPGSQGASTAANSPEGSAREVEAATGPQPGSPIVARRTSFSFRPDATAYPGDDELAAKMDVAFAGTIVALDGTQGTRRRRAAPQAAPAAVAEVPDEEATEPLAELAEAADELPTEIADGGEVHLQVELETEIGRGALTLYADNLQIFSEEFRFVERSKVLRRAKNASGTLSGTATVPAGTTSLRVYLAPRKQPTQVITLNAEFGGSDSAVLRITLAEDGTADANFE